MKASQLSLDIDGEEAIEKCELGTKIPVQVYELGWVRRGEEKSQKLPQEEGPFGAFASF